MPAQGFQHPKELVSFLMGLYNSAYDTHSLQLLRLHTFQHLNIKENSVQEMNIGTQNLNRQLLFSEENVKDVFKRNYFLAKNFRD